MLPGGLSFKAHPCQPSETRAYFPSSGTVFPVEAEDENLTREEEDRYCAGTWPLRRTVRHQGDPTW